MPGWGWGDGAQSWLSGQEPPALPCPLPSTPTKPSPVAPAHTDLCPLIMEHLLFDE